MHELSLKIRIVIVLNGSELSRRSLKILLILNIIILSPYMIIFEIEFEEYERVLKACLNEGV